MPVRRNADPQVVQHVWDGSRFSMLQHQCADILKLTKYVQNACNVNQQEAEVYIKQVIKDNLLVSIKKTGRYADKDQAVENFIMSTTDTNMDEDDGHDWYCIECHLAGDVINCTTCFRVFHLDCIKNTNNNRVNINKHSPLPGNRRKNNNISTYLQKNNNEEEKKGENDEMLVVGVENENHLTCNICKMMLDNNTIKIDKEELNYLLNFTLNRIRMWLPNNITDVMAPRVHHPWMNENEIGLRVRHLLYQTMDIPIIEMKLRTKEYNHLSEFHADVLTIQHNVAIFHGVDSQEFQGSELMVIDSKYDLVEIQQCVDCYRHSNEKRNDMWFCIPCRPPHKLVWAKQKGYPHWPAKVIRVLPNEQHDVRFFGAKHLRALIDKASVKPIEINTQTLQLKKTQAFQKAMQELTEHQRLLQNPDDVSRFLAQLPLPKIKSPGNKNKQTRKSIVDLTVKPVENNLEDVYEFTDTVNLTFNESSSNVTKKKRGRPKGTPNVRNKKSKIEQPILTLENTDSNFDQVSSSTEETGPYLHLQRKTNKNSRTRSASCTITNGTQQLERVYSNPVENLRRQLENLTDKDGMIRTALETMQNEIDRLQNEHSARVREINDAQNVTISEIKKKQWCYYCEQEAIYHCCWNTAYCSTVCQQQHWQTDHKKVCRRKR